jgi:hypothetical protein
MNELAQSGRIAVPIKQWSAHPTAVLHCGIDLQPSMASQGETEFPSFTTAVIVHGLAIAMLAAGAKAVVNESNTTSMTRCKVIEPDYLMSPILLLVIENSSEHLLLWAHSPPCKDFHECRLIQLNGVIIHLKKRYFASAAIARMTNTKINRCPIPIPHIMPPMPSCIIKSHSLA